MATADETRDELIAALLRLVRERSLSEVSVRDIAAEAGVNHGLVHRYFGSKDALIQQATARVSEEVHRGYPGQRGLSAFTFRYLAERPELVRVLAQACLDRDTAVLEAVAPPEDRLCEIVDTVREALEGTGTPVDPRVVNAYAISSILGWLLFKPMLEVGFDLPEDADDQVAGAMQLLDLMVAAKSS